jgi:hypothetical protein
MKAFSLVCLIILLACSGPKTTAPALPEMPASGQVAVIYLHTSEGCAICNAVGQIARETVEKTFADWQKEGRIVFRSYDLDDPGVDDFARKLGVSVKSLLVVKDGKVIDLTADAFLYALANPEKYKTLLQQTINSL